jgi:putative transposase
MGQRKKFNSTERLEILRYYEQHGAVRTTREYAVSVTSIYKWKSILEAKGEKGLEGISKHNISAEEGELRRLRRENQQLRNLVADKEMRLQIQSEMLKKSR